MDFSLKHSMIDPMTIFATFNMMKFLRHSTRNSWSNIWILSVVQRACLTVLDEANYGWIPAPISDDARIMGESRTNADNASCNVAVTANCDRNSTLS